MFDEKNAKRSKSYVTILKIYVVLLSKILSLVILHTTICSEIQLKIQDNNTSMQVIIIVNKKKKKN